MKIGPNESESESENIIKISFGSFCLKLFASSFLLD